MPKGFYAVPHPRNETVLSYGPGSKERAALKKAIEAARSMVLDIPMYIGGEEVRSGNTKDLRPPHDHKHILGHFHAGDKSHVEQAINAAMAAKGLWANLSWEHRASIFLKAADLLAGPYRYKINAATMLGQSKNAYQAEIDSACELIDFLRFNVYFMSEIYRDQPESSPGVWNRIEYRPLEGFVFHYVFANRLPDILENFCTAGKVNAAKITIFKNYFSGIRTTHIDQVDDTVRESGFLQYLHDYLCGVNL